MMRERTRSSLSQSTSFLSLPFLILYVQVDSLSSPSYIDALYVYVYTCVCVYGAAPIYAVAFSLPSNDTRAVELPYVTRLFITSLPATVTTLFSLSVSFLIGAI